MAKQRRENDFVDEPCPQPQAGLVELPTPETDPEKEALRARISELEALLGSDTRTANIDPVSNEPAVMRYWRVELDNAPTHVVRAIDRANAWEQYKQELGVIGSQYEPAVSGSDREAYRAAQARRFNCRPEEVPLPDE